MIRTVFLCIVVFTVLLSCKEAKKDDPTRPNSKYNAPLVLDGMRHGLIKPPVNIIGSENDSLSYDIYLDRGSMQEESSIKGKKVELLFGPEEPMLIDGSEVEFKQLHFHTPSYHLIEGEEYAMELNVVTVPVSKQKSNPEYLVISILFRTGQFNPFIEELLQNPLNFSGPEQESQLHILMGGRAMVSKTNDNLNGFYHYIGPLATKPYSNSVHWYIARKVFEISEEQFVNIKQRKIQD